MQEASSGEKVPSDRQGPTLVLGSLRLTGAPAALVGILLLAIIVGIAVWLSPPLRWTPLWISAGLWIVFIGYWSAAARHSAQTKTSESRQSRSLHQALMNGSLLLLFIRLPWLGRRVLPEESSIIAAGITLHVASFLLAVWARKHLGRNWSGAITAKVDHALIRTGPYRFVRHPIYTAMLGMFAGTAIVSGELHALLAVAIMSVAYWRKIRLEEAHLQGIFGSAYYNYRLDSWALVPWVF